MTIIHIIIPLITAFTGAYIAHLFSVGREDRNHKRMVELLKIQEFNKASAAFRSAFIKEIRTLRHNGTDVANILANAIGRHERAMIIFRPNLTANILESFDTAWREYACPHKTDPDYVDMEQYFSNETNEKERLRKLAFQRIENLFEYAKPR